MKKIFALFIAFLFVLSFAIFASAEGFTSTTVVMSNTAEPLPSTVSNGEPTTPQRDRYTLFTLWDTAGYPDDIGWISGVESTSGYNPQDPESVPGQITVEYMIYIVRGASEERKAEITALAEKLENEYLAETGISRNLKIKFIDCTLSYSQLWEYRKSIETALGELTYGVGVAPSQRDIGFTVYYENDRDMSKIKETISGNFAEIINLIEFCLGDPNELTDSGGMPEIVYSGQGTFLPTIGGKATDLSTGSDENKNYTVFFFVGLGLLAAGVVAFCLVKLRTRAAVLSTGETVQAGTVTSKDVENLVKTDTETPSEHVIDDIYKRM